MKYVWMYCLMFVVLGSSGLAMDTLYKNKEITVLTVDIPHSQGKFFAVFHTSETPEYCDSMKKEQIQLIGEMSMEKMYLFSVQGINKKGDTIKAYLETGTRVKEIVDIKTLLETCKTENQRITIWYTGHESDPKILWIQAIGKQVIKFFTPDQKEKNRFDVRWCIKDG